MGSPPRRRLIKSRYRPSSPSASGRSASTISLMRSSPSASPSKSSASSRALLLPLRRKSSVAQASTRWIDQGSDCGSLTRGNSHARGVPWSLFGLGRHAARGGNAGDFEAAFGGWFLRGVWVPRRAIKREKIRGPREFALGEAAAGWAQYRAPCLPLPAPPGPIPEAVPPDAAVARAGRERDL